MKQQNTKNSRYQVEFSYSTRHTMALHYLNVIETSHDSICCHGFICSALVLARVQLNYCSFIRYPSIFCAMCCRIIHCSFLCWHYYGENKLRALQAYHFFPLECVDTSKRNSRTAVTLQSAHAPEDFLRN